MFVNNNNNNNNILKPLNTVRDLSLRYSNGLNFSEHIASQASLESVKASSGKEFQLLNPDRHKDRILKAGVDVATVRPDITHQCLLMLLDSPLNRVGKLQVSLAFSV
ncbi:unnamed protein product [Schistosoma curassoni]|uniref:ABC transporter ATP-binding protein n=1 Tax=Schistosoma curassoni TaxID=6186 RepID=A0A183KUB4_9TREM|nr:unnamed protein product [Schistosoma curassoni]